ncbi:UNVERIFIED_CONTAM: putative protein, chloroplastic [Sesamum radiatum]|uniref:NAD-dependent epimerase/dehydratase domain-containing protein n=1 Tax=Sesamum radiatum TaxID=300843 RepID=A0AAW2MF12_SESRA
MSRLIHHSKFMLYRFSIATSRNGRFLSTGPDKSVGPNGSAKTDKVEEAETVELPPPPTEKLLVLGGNGFVGSHICKEALNRGLTVASLSRSGRSSIQESWANSVIWHQGNLFSTDSWKDVLKGVTSIRAAETELLTRYPYGGVILRPGFIHGTRHVGSLKLPLSVIGSPLEMVLQHAKPLSQVPLVGPLLTPPVSANAVAKVAVRAAN